jgi:hypothetical protein
MHNNLDHLLGDTLHHKLALVIVLNGRVLQKGRGQIRSRLVLSPFFTFYKKAACFGNFKTFSVTIIPFLNEKHYIAYNKG